MAKKNSAERAARIELLRSACIEAIKLFPPTSTGVTFCNRGVHYIASRLGYLGFASKYENQALLANQIVSKFKNGDPDWARVQAQAAQDLANSGNLVIAGAHGEEHGHVAAVYPGGVCVKSGKWNGLCPTVANVGKENGVKGANWCFSDEPGYWVLIDSQWA